MRRTVTLSALAAVLAATAAGSALAVGSTSQPTAQAESARANAADRARQQRGTLLDRVPERGVLRVCTTGDYRPFSHRDPKSGAYTGIDIKMAGDLAESLDAKPKYVPTTWATLVDDLAAGRCDVGMGGVSVTLARARKASFSEPYLTDGKTPIVRCEDKDKYRTLEEIDQPGVRVVVNPGGTNEQFARAHIKQATLTVHPDNTTIFDEIIAGRADVMMTDASETRYQSAIHPELCAVHPDEPFSFSEKAYVLPRGDSQFKEYVDQWVHLATHDGTYKKYEDEWMKR
ncbi:transporter substrate-binding domain-containing protein [Streptomyces rapamycinicus]|uniref:PheC n=2 Tax=Streptomyces rapamycinicus TaxID=1226757 RepID=A0A0A0NBE9_STRRN|nr:transporter substrate-binding domain-containing protein [Streptomyces rapamycinicus]AGP54299.1 PheC [Streptomyces rapamycinicus NRRL 5491]MBB4781802.1 cyclohexadienyl dehydratase [Streptomyces rapamycinicus]RLV73555.1 PheC [Streptomyces rapamycinicus NRRL 5491]UTO62371.1 transporter substrate-binding domain-containing protein [Streptomyces rapamycinicus]UTP30327.1 transporter substrate-binding domain-containing protein [Streptomyces rapamycinicus NRRL 5491]